MVESSNSPFENGNKTMQLDVDVTDKIAHKEITHEDWDKEYAPFLFGETGVLSFKLYSSCNCKLEVALNFQKEGLGASTDEKRCDLCRKEPRTVNYQRMNAIMKGLHSYVDDWIEENWVEFTEVVKRTTGRDLVAEGVSSPEVVKAHDVLMSARSLSKMVDTLLDWVDVTRLSSSDKRELRMIISAYEEIKGQKYFEDISYPKKMHDVAKEVADELHEAGERGEIKNENDFIKKIEQLLEEKARKLNDNESEGVNE